MCVCVGGGCLCACVCMWVFIQLEEQSGITSPGGGSWGVCCDPIKRQTGSGTHCRKQEDFPCQNIPALEFKKQAKSLQTGWIYIWGGGGTNDSLSLKPWNPDSWLLWHVSGGSAEWPPAQFPLHSSFQSDPDLPPHLPLLTGAPTSTHPFHILLCRPSP